MSIQLWQVKLWASEPQLRRLLPMLDPAERAQADRFVFPWLRVRYIVAHAALRVAVARARGCAPASLAWVAGPHGKPSLRDHPLAFNLSHSGDWGLIAVGGQADIGVDIEAVHPPRVTPALIRTVTSSTELRAFESMSERERQIAFFRLWVRKEAVIKALGTGLSRPLDTIDVPLGADAPVDGIRLHPSSPDPGVRWWVWDLSSPLGYCSALVLGQPGTTRPPAPGPVGVLDLEDLVPGPSWA